MIRLHAIIGLLICLLSPTDAAAFWLADGQCGESESPQLSEMSEPVSVSEVKETDCDGVLDPTDSSYNACFELAENPISTLPELIAQEQAERVVAALLETTDDVTALTPLLPSPTEASVEDPELPGRPLVAKPPVKRPRPTPNSCSAFPDDCENQPHVPTLNLEASVSPADKPSDELDVPPAILPETRRGPPASGVGPALGVTSRLDRPPQAG